jgi:hypothetical protein
MLVETEFVTDTATLCLFDEEVMKHRLDDTADWWSDPFEELEEVNEGNALFIGLRSDGKYKARIRLDDRAAPGNALTARVKCSSGHLFVGPGEEMCGEGIGPDTETGGVFLDLAPATYEASIRFTALGELEINLRRTEDEASNSFPAPLALTS